MDLGGNIRIRRKEAGWTQQQLADRAKITRGLVTAYEQNRATPPLDVMIRLADTFGIDLNSLISKPSKPPMKSKKDVLTITVDSEGRENVELVNHRASAGYLAGLQDEEFIKELPKLHLPFLPRNRTYRAFEIIGDSMLPIQPNSIVIAEFVENLSELRNGDSCIIVTKQEGITFKRVYNFLKDMDRILMVSDNTFYQPYLVKAIDVLEVWRKRKIISDEVSIDNNITGKQLASLVLEIQQQVSKGTRN